MARNKKSEFAEPTMEEQGTLKTHFPSTVGKEEDDETNYVPVPQGYERYRLKELEDGETFDGKPYLSNILESTFEENGKEVTKYRCRFVLIDDTDGCFCDINLNLKSGNLIQKNIHKNSVLYDFISSIMDLEKEGWSKQYKGGIDKANLQEYIDFVNDLSYMEITVKTVTLEGLAPFNSFKVTKAEL